MPRFFLDNIEVGEVYITGIEASHIKNSLRMKIGDKLTLSDGKGYEYGGIIRDIQQDVLILILNKTKSKNESNFNVNLYQCLPKGDKLETIIQKSVELGANSITPVLSNRTISRHDNKSFVKKLERYRKICLEACKQSERAYIPTINNIIPFNSAIDECSSTMGCTNIIFYEKFGEKMGNILLNDRNISIFVGSEGGFEDYEIEYAKRKGFNICSLGNRILRCETAAIASISIIMNILGDI